MSNPCSCLDLCKCFGGCCKKYCGNPVCDHETYECVCGAKCDYCKKEEKENVIIQNNYMYSISNELDIGYDADTDGYDADTE